MKKLKSSVKTMVGKLANTAAKLKRTASAHWRSLSPGLRYALVYSLCALCISGLAWWQLRPEPGYVFVPGPNGEQEEHQHPHEQDPGEEVPAEETAFVPERGDKLLLPLEGEILAAPGDGFQPAPGTYWTLAGLHIDGLAGDAVAAALSGTVTKVVHPDIQESGKVEIAHGDWITVYVNLDNICVTVGQRVTAGQKIGELAPKPWGNYAGDFLEFELWGPDGEAHDPRDYVGAEQ
ncbi:MAG: M23 family metallopeptidase [Firmicutes bacterium]|nr:M23 family metallopeptidase [Bacillota bacterium]HPZ90171.1 M23 family metallopeptidase [Bacillota bacterium]HQE01561.1 M23 family metallopeptidase [Bacillota bacterium]